MPRRYVLALLFTCATLLFPNFSFSQTREEKVRNDRKQVQKQGYWIYNDIDKGFVRAKKTGKPMLVVLRCIPCEECVKLDEELMHKDTKLKALMDQFVRVRLVSTNGLDLSLFQYDYDQSFAVFLLNADHTIYGRFGTRSHRTLWSEDVSIAGLGKAMEASLEMHANFKKYRPALLGKTGPKPKISSPEKYPLLKGRFKSTINTKKNIVKSCIHCHQIGDAQRDQFRKKRKPFPVKTLFPYPHPKILGLIMDPQEKAIIKQVATDSPASQAGFQNGDEILSLNGQPIISIADIQWVLHHTSKKEATIQVKVKRGNEVLAIKLSMKEGWKQKDDISWRVTSWALCRMVAGGMRLETATAAERKKLGINNVSKMVLRVKSVGQYGAHATAKKAGFKKGDFVIAFGKQSTFLRETDWFAYALNQYPIGRQIPVTVIRGKRKLRLMLPMKP